MSKHMMPIKCDVKCDNIVEENLIDLKNKNSSNILKKIEIIQNNKNMKDNVIGLVSKNIPRHVFNKRKNKYGL
jgi:hypothetical protein